MREREAQQVLELSANFLLDQVKFARQLLDFVDALLILAVTQANVDALMRDPVLQRTHATYDAPPPDELRRPISINALAISLRLPFETVRRRVIKLSLLGIFRSSRDGIFVPTAQANNAAHRRVVQASYDRIAAMYARVASLDGFRDIGWPDLATADAPPLRAAARVSSEYVLRLVDVVTAQLGDPVDSAIWLEVLRSSAPEGARLQGTPIMQVARRIGLPSETVRRRLAALIAADYCQKGANGVTITQARLDAPDFAGIADKNLVYLRRMFATLSQLRPAQTARIYADA